MRDDAKAEDMSPYLPWGIWLMWLPVVIQPTIDLLQMPPSLQKAASGVGFVLFIEAA